MTNESKVRLESTEGEIFEVAQVVASESQLVKDLIEDMGTDSVIPLPKVSSRILAKVIKYCQYHVDARTSSDDEPGVQEAEVRYWDALFVKVDQATIFLLTLAANYLNIKSLLYLMCKTVVKMSESETPEEMCWTFSDITPKEERSGAEAESADD